MATTDDEARALRELPGWERHGDSIWKTYQFDDFASAALFVGRVADATAGGGHQPDIAIRGGRVTLELTPRAGSALTDDDLMVGGPHPAAGGRPPPPGGPGRPVGHHALGPASERGWPGNHRRVTIRAGRGELLVVLGIKAVNGVGLAVVLDEPTAALGGRHADLFAPQASAYLAPRRPSPASGSRRYSTKSWPW